MAATIKSQTASRRQTETLVARQARVGIVANPKSISLQTPVPRDVWHRWPDFRSARRCAAKAQDQTQQGADLAAFDAFVASVRRAGHDPVEASGPVDAGDDCLPNAPPVTKPRRKFPLLGLVLGLACLGVSIVALGAWR